MALLHVICFLWAIFALTQNLGLPKPVRKVRDDSYGGQWKYLTFLNQVDARNGKRAALAQISLGPFARGGGGALGRVSQ